MRVADLYGFVLVLGLTGILVGIVLTVLGKLALTTGMTSDASTGINNTVTAIKSIPDDWLTIVVTVGVLAVILGLVMAGFAGASMGRR